MQTDLVQGWNFGHLIHFLKWQPLHPKYLHRGKISHQNLANNYVRRPTLLFNIVLTCINSYLLPMCKEIVILKIWWLYIYIYIYRSMRVQTPVMLLHSLSNKYPWEKYESPYPPIYGLNSTTTVLLKGWIWH